jgi:hypothetical protein
MFTTIIFIWLVVWQSLWRIWLSVVEFLADMVKFGGVVSSDHIWWNPIKFGRLGVGASQPRQFLKI